MPWGASRLHNDMALAAVKSALIVDPASPFGLRWRDDYTESRRATPGAEAGSYAEAIKQYVVTVKGYPLYSRHAVWMLTHDSMIPHEQDIRAIDGNLSNLHPDNLEAYEVKKVRAQRGSVRHRRGSKRQAPDKATFYRMGDAYLADIYVGRHKLPFIATMSRPRTLKEAMYCAMCWGFYPMSGVPGLSEERAATLAEFAASVYKHDPEAPTSPNYEAAKASFLDHLTDESRDIRRVTEAQAAETADATAQA